MESQKANGMYISVVYQVSISSLYTCMYMFILNTRLLASSHIHVCVQETDLGQFCSNGFFIIFLAMHELQPTDSNQGGGLREGRRE